MSVPMRTSYTPGIGVLFFSLFLLFFGACFIRFLRIFSRSCAPAANAVNSAATRSVRWRNDFIALPLSSRALHPAHGLAGEPVLDRAAAVCAGQPPVAQRGPGAVLAREKQLQAIGGGAHRQDV